MNLAIDAPTSLVRASLEPPRDRRHATFIGFCHPLDSDGELGEEMVAVSEVTGGEEE